MSRCSVWLLIGTALAVGCRTAPSTSLTGTPVSGNRVVFIGSPRAAAAELAAARLPPTTTENATSSPAAKIQLAAHQAPSALPNPNSASEKTTAPVVRSAQEAAEQVPPKPGAPLAVRRPPISLKQVTESVYTAYPALEALMREMDIAAGKETAAWGEFDLKVKAESLAAPEGFYQNYRNQLKVEQGLFPGGNVFGQYRIGDGSFPTWYGERETNEGGEFKVGLITPLLRDRSIDQRRADIFQATLRRQQVDPMVQSQLLEFTFWAADAYWSWLAAGLSVQAQKELLRVTIERNQVYEERVKQKDLAPIELVQNQRLIASREAKLIEAERKLQQSAIKLSLFLRDEFGQPVLPQPAQLPADFPAPSAPNRETLDSDIAQALTDRPELRELDVLREQASVDLAVGQNLRLPGLNAVVEASKDVGAPASSKRDKTPFELEAGLLFDVPLQRRKAEGKIREAEGKLAQLAAKRRFAENKITVQVQDAMSAMATAYERVGRARENHRLAQQLEKAERDRFEAQDSDLLRVALQEAAEIEAALLVIEALADFFKAEAAYRAALAIDPLTVE